MIEGNRNDSLFLIEKYSNGCLNKLTHLFRKEYTIFKRIFE